VTRTAGTSDIAGGLRPDPQGIRDTASPSRVVPEPEVLRTRLGRGLVARITREGGQRTLVVEGIRSEHTLRTFSRAVAVWQAFGRYQRPGADRS
jgi:hypothetical protein